MTPMPGLRRGAGYGSRGKGGHQGGARGKTNIHDLFSLTERSNKKLCHGRKDTRPPKRNHIRAVTTCKHL
jgi:hypothetical protein